MKVKVEVSDLVIGQKYFATDLNDEPEMFFIGRVRDELWFYPAHSQDIYEQENDDTIGFVVTEDEWYEEV